MTEICIIDYSEKAAVVTGDTKPIKDLLKDAGGKFNARLTHPLTRKPLAGWIFSKKRIDTLKGVLIANGIKYGCSVDSEAKQNDFIVDPAEIEADNFCQTNNI